MKYPNIAFCGKAGAGKTTAAQYLIDKMGYTKVSFAGKLKEIATNACGMKEKNRELLQKLGVEIRSIDENFWIKAAFKNIDKLIEQDKHIVIDDLRFQNEYNRVRNEGFYVFRVIRPREDRLRVYGFNPKEIHEFEIHESETALDHEHMYSIYNNCPLDKFYGKLDRSMEDILYFLEK